MELNLGFDEGIVLETNGVTWIGNEKMHLQELILTNKNLYLAYKKSNGFFSKATDGFIQKPLSDIKVINGQPMVGQVRNGSHGICLQIQFLQGNEQFAFAEAAKRNVASWTNALWQALVGTDAPASQKPGLFGEIGSLGGGIGEVAANLKDVADSAVQSVSDAAKQVAGQVNVSYVNAIEQRQASKRIHAQEETASQMAFTQTPPPINCPTGGFCEKCGAKLGQNARFCPACGAAVSTRTLSGEVPPVPTAQPFNPDTRQQEFAGKILKCPNCGAAISQMTAVCPECGHRITGQAAVSSVQAFSDRLMLLEVGRKRAGVGQLLGVTADPVDTQKLSLIRSFPIPNTIDDIQEFMLLAIANIDVGLSKNTWNNRHQGKIKGGLPSVSMPKAISDAWVAKMIQAFQKASASFPNDPAFTYVKHLYVDKMAELKMKTEG